MTVTPYNPYSPNLDFGLVQKLSATLGRLTVSNDYIEEQLKRQQQAYEAQIAAAKAQAEENAATLEPESDSSSTLESILKGGLFGSGNAISESDSGPVSAIADGTMTALDWTIDKISRPLYAVDAGIDQAIKQNEDQIKDDQGGLLANLTGGWLAHGEVPPLWDFLPSSGSELKNDIEAMGRGFTGKEKKTTADLLAHLDSLDRKQDIPDWQLGVAGLVGDAFLDPLSYVGVGVVNEGIKGVKLLGKGFDTSKAIKSAGYIDPDTDSMIQKIVDMRVEHPVKQVDIEGNPTGEIINVTLDRKDIEPLFGITRKMSPRAHAAMTQSDRKKEFDSAINVLSSVKSHLTDVNEAARFDPHIQAIDNQIDELRKGIDFGDTAQQEFLNRTTADLIERMEKSGEMPKVPADVAHLVEGSSVVSAVHLADIKDIISKQSLLESAEKRLAKTPNSYTLKEEVKNLSRELEDVKGSWWDGDLIDPEWRRTEIKAARDRAVERIPENSDYSKKRLGALVSQKRANNQLFRAAKTQTEKAAILDRNRRVGYEIKRIYDYWHSRTAEAFSVSLSNHVVERMIARGDFADVTRLDSEIVNLEAQITAHEAVPGGDTPIHMAGEEETAIRQGEKLGQDGLQDMKTQLAALNKTRAQKVKELVTGDYSFRGKTNRIVREGDADFQEIKQQHINALADVLFQERAKSWRRRNRLGGTSRKAFEGSGGVGDLKPRITLNDGNKVTYEEFASLPPETKTEYFIDADRKAGHHENNPAKAAKKEVKKLHYAPEPHAFKRLFQREHNMSIQEYTKVAKRAREDARKGVVEFSNGSSSKRFSKTEYITTRSRTPNTWVSDDDLALINGHLVKRSDFKAQNLGKPGQFDAALYKFAKEQPTEFRKMLEGQFDEAYKAINGRPGPGNLMSLGEVDTALTSVERNKIKSWAQHTATERFKNVTEVKGHVEVIDQPVLISTKSSADHILELTRQNKRAEATAIANERLNAKLEKRKPQTEQLRELFRKRSEKIQEMQREINLTAKAMTDEIHAQSIINLAARTSGPEVGSLRIRAFGRPVLDIPTPEALLTATQKLSGLPVLSGASKIWQSAFIASRGMERDLNLARLNAQHRTPELIKFRVDELRRDFSKFKPSVRKDSFRYLQAGGKPRNDIDQLTLDWFDNIAEYFSGHVKIGFDTLGVKDINRYLPKEFWAVGKNADDYVVITDGSSLINSLRNVGDTDPLQVMWRISQAVEQAKTWKGMIHVIRNQFAIRQGGPNDDIIQKLRTDLPHEKRWLTHPDIGEDWLMDPKVYGDVTKMLKMLEHKEIQEITRLYDKVMNVWRSTVTVYNIPGFYARNGIGEVIMGAFDNVLNPVWYQKAGRMLKYGITDEVKESLKTLEPWRNFQSKTQEASRPLIQMRSGKTLSVAESQVLYREMGLHTGFISTSWDTYAPSLGGLRSNPVGQLAEKINTGMRKRSEAFEDYFRMAHFISRMERSKLRDPYLAAKEASEYVRKYHFDYTDFTKFEKTSMIRLFPFYKWNRKSVPMMLGMLFTNPAKMNLYPKTMSNISYGTGAVDPLADEDGFIPNYDAVVPEWMRKGYSYATGQWGDNDSMVYGNLSTPQFDALKGLAAPNDFVLSNLSPGIKVPLEDVLGVNKDSTGQKRTLVGSYPIKDQWQYFLRQTPQGALADTLKYKHESGESTSDILKDPRFLSFLTGLGLWENTPERQQGELFRQSLGGSGN